MLAVPPPVTVRVPAKINLHLSVGPLRDDGYHDLVTVFHAVSLFDDVTVSATDEPDIQVHGEGVSEVPVDETNLAWRAVQLLAEHAGRPPDVRLLLRKGIPVAGGMAGGSADAAAALVGLSALWKLDLTRDELAELAAQLGSDVTFALYGGTALGTGRGERIVPVLARHPQHWVIALHAAAGHPGRVRELTGAHGQLCPQRGQPVLDPCRGIAEWPFRGNACRRRRELAPDGVAPCAPLLKPVVLAGTLLLRPTCAFSYRADSASTWPPSGLGASPIVRGARRYPTGRDHHEPTRPPPAALLARRRSLMRPPRTVQWMLSPAVPGLLPGALDAVARCRARHRIACSVNGGVKTTL